MKIIEDLLASARGAADNIQVDAQQRGFAGDITDAAAVLDYLANRELDNEDYALLYANSAVVEMCCRTVRLYGNAADKAEAARLAAFDYNA